MVTSNRYVLSALAATCFIAVCAAVLSWGTMPQADFTFANGTEIQSVDPAIVTGQPEGRIIRALSEGLYRNLPAHLDPDFDPGRDGDRYELRPQPATAVAHELSSDGLTYTFHLRPSARWSDGSPVTAHDFSWSWKRFLHPETPNQYVYQLSDYVAGAKKFNLENLELGDRVEVELPDRLRPQEPYPSGTMLPGTLRAIHKPAKPLTEGFTDAQREQSEVAWQRSWVYEVDVHPVAEETQEVSWDTSGAVRWFSKTPALATVPAEAGNVEACLRVMPDFDTYVGIRALDDRTLQVTLDHPTAYFLDLVSFYVLYPVHRPTVERWGYPAWTKPEHLVSNGPYRIAFRRLRDRIRLTKNETYWNADAVALRTIDAMAITSQTTMLNMYVKGQIDWMDDPPQSVIPQLRERSDWVSSTRLATYFYRLNVTRPPLDDVRVRQALNLAMNKQELCESVTRAGEITARSLVPPGLPGYESAACAGFNVERARELLDAAGYPGGQGFPRLEILYNTNENHRTIAEVLQQQWSKNLGIRVDLKNREWGVYLDDTENQNYFIARAGWIGDYADPNTFLDMFVGDGPNNMTGWKNAPYDGLLNSARAELDPDRRFAILHDAESILMKELPIIPIYFYVSKNLVRSDFEGFHGNLQDVHPLHLLRPRTQARTNRPLATWIGTP